MRTYEVLFILSPQVTEEEFKTLVEDFRGDAERAGAKLLKEEAWGRRRLAYPIEKFNEGIYHLFVFDTEEYALAELDRRMKNSDRVLRHMISRTDEGLKRAAKLAKRNPKKERRPLPTAAAAVAPASPAAEQPAAVESGAEAAPESPAAASE
jgi:small subunit ribosomal protein S6